MLTETLKAKDSKLMPVCACHTDDRRFVSDNPDITAGKLSLRLRGVDCGESPGSFNGSRWKVRPGRCWDLSRDPVSFE